MFCPIVSEVHCSNLVFRISDKTQVLIIQQLRPIFNFRISEGLWQSKDEFQDLSGHRKALKSPKLTIKSEAFHNAYESCSWHKSRQTTWSVESQPLQLGEKQRRTVLLWLIILVSVNMDTDDVDNCRGAGGMPGCVKYCKVDILSQRLATVSNLYRNEISTTTRNRHNTYQCYYFWLLSNWNEISTILLCLIQILSCLQCFDTVGWATGRASGL